jgi:hypothetical protein
LLILEAITQNSWWLVPFLCTLFIISQPQQAFECGIGVLNEDTDNHYPTDINRQKGLLSLMKYELLEVPIIFMQLERHPNAVL